MLSDRTIPRRGVLLGSLAVLGGCALKPVAIDSSAMAGIHAIALPTPGFPKSPDVAVIQGVGQQLGLIGIISTAVVRGNRSDALVALMQSRGFDPRQVFVDELRRRLQALRLGILDVPADPTRRSFVTDYPAPGSDDAALDVFISQYGLFAFSDSDDSPYRPGISLSMRLVSARDRSVLMQDKVVNAGIDAPVAGAPTRDVPPSFTSFSDVTANPDLAIRAMQLEMSFAAQTVVSRLA